MKQSLEILCRELHHTRDLVHFYQTLKPDHLLRSSINRDGTKERMTSQDQIIILREKEADLEKTITVLKTIIENEHQKTEG